ncbi:hypothetical protein [Kocuria marina]|uniref:hypothetical protein n=1 Tax=Kocuria marina TaxID=223184 RepID=UPI0034602741
MSPDDLKSVMPLLTGSIAALSFARLIWLPNTRAERAKQLGTSLGNLKAWDDFAKHDSPPLSPKFLDDQMTRSTREVERDAIALAVGTAWDQLWLFASFFCAMGGLWLTIYKVDEVVHGGGYAWAWWGSFAGALGFLALAGLLDRRGIKIAASVPKAVDPPGKTVAPGGEASPKGKVDG